ncbi:MAG: hypothetical protein U0031_18935 [Thermomicrobiales bacterium]
MNGMRFDALSRGLAGRESRRTVLRRLAVAGLGVSVVGVEQTQARKRHKSGHKGLTERCKKSVECKGTTVCRTANSQHYYPETEKRCCLELGEHCNDGFECCGIDVICNGGYCQSA